MSILSKSKILLISIPSGLILVFLFVDHYRIEANSIQDSGDEFFVSLPIDRQVISGSQNIVWKASDDDQEEVLTEVRLLDDECEQLTGKIADNADVEVHNDFYNFLWNTNQPTAGISDVEDGNYCIQVVSAFLNGEMPYALSATRIVKIEMIDNALPEIVSAPPQPNITLGTEFIYQVEVEDLDEDEISYTTLQGAEWLTVSESGLVSGTPDRLGTFMVILEVSDGTDKVLQVFSINIAEGSNTLPQIKFESPTSSSILNGNSNKVNWNLSNIEGETQTLELSRDGISWSLISKLQGGEKDFDWDVISIESGGYIIRLSLADSSGETYARFVSKRFIIANQPAESVESVPLIYSVSPSEDSAIEILRPNISGRLVASDGAEIDTDSVQVFLDGIEIIDGCQTSVGNFNCELDRDLNIGLHKLKVLVTDSFSISAEKEWTFSVLGEEEITEESFEPIEESPFQLGNLSQSSLIIIVGVFCLILLLLIIPWALYIIWRRKNKENEDYGDVTPQGVSTPPSGAVTQIPYNPNEYKIGSQELGDTNTGTPPETSVTDFTTPSDDVQVEQPDWLSGNAKSNENIGESAQPVTATGEEAQTGLDKEDLEGSQPYGGYGLKPVGDGE